ncbi:HPr family phosphocarrier protein [Haloglycomyces albus]|uniref:HPr family phosphocarrier protein n=1 Tax=Haloglycomyces albus TaxID=526067 RepID=UPI00046D22AA|nr:HPr family phosphocarrier protein [Haloglycomyces albus]
MAQKTLEVTLETGLHARPAAQFVQTASESDVDVTIAKGDGDPVNAKSMLSLMGLDVRKGDQITLETEDNGVLDKLEVLVTTGA